MTRHHEVVNECLGDLAQSQAHLTGKRSSALMANPKGSDLSHAVWCHRRIVMMVYVIEAWMNQVATVGSSARLRRSWEPCAALRPFVISFELRDDHLGKAEVLNPLPARSDCFLQFHFNQPYLVVNRSTGQIQSAPAKVLVGPHTGRREDLIWRGDLKAFTIRFSPVGFHSLFGVPASAVRDVATSAELILGPAVQTLEARLADACDDHMPSIAEKFLLTKLAGQSDRGRAFAVLRIANAIRRYATGPTLQTIASAHNLSLRQVERLFQEFVGLSPKCFMRLHRANTALSLHRVHPARNWSSIASASGYFDQAHMIREFRSLNDSTPESFARAGSLAEKFRSRPSGLTRS